MPVDEDLHGGVRDVPLATNHIGNTHGDIVNNDSEIVQGKTIGARDHRIANGVRVNRESQTSSASDDSGSVQLMIDGRIQVMQFDPCVLGGKAPGDATVPGVALGL